MVGMARDPLWFEHDECGDVGSEPGVDVPVELRVRNRVEPAVGEVEQCDLRDTEDARRVEELPAADVAKALDGADSAGFAVGEAQDTDLSPLAREVGEERAESERLVVRMRDYRTDRTL
jgi:hypothetical protein